MKDKAFFFGGYEGYRLRNTGAPVINTVPTAYEEQHPGDFTDVGGPTVTNLDQAGLAYFKMYPAPNQGTNQFYRVPGELQNSNDFDSRGDFHLGSNDALFARYILNKAYTQLPSGMPLATVGTVKPFDPLGDYATDLNYNAMLGYTHIFSPTLLLHFAANYTRADNDDIALAGGLNPNAAMGQANVNVPGTGVSMLANIVVSGGTSLGNSLFIPVQHQENAFQYFGSIIYTHGNHNMQFGGSILRRQVHTVQSSFPNEMHNLYSKPGYEELIHHLQARMEELRTQTDDHYRYQPHRPAALSQLPSGEVSADNNTAGTIKESPDLDF